MLAILCLGQHLWGLSLNRTLASKLAQQRSAAML